MARIAGVNLPGQKRLVIALQYLYGVGQYRAQQICEKSGVDKSKRVNDLQDKEITAIRVAIDQNFKIEGNLRREVGMNIKRLMDLGCYRGLRHRKSLPSRGQRTHTNARTRKGKSLAIAGKKIAPRK